MRKSANPLEITSLRTFKSGAADGARTRMKSPSRDFKSLVYASSTTAAYPGEYINMIQYLGGKVNISAPRQRIHKSRLARQRPFQYNRGCICAACAVFGGEAGGGRQTFLTG